MSWFHTVVHCTLWLTLDSIVALTLTRVLLTVYVVPQNPTKGETLTSLLTALEPILGVINACLPFIPLIIKRIGQTNFFQSVSASVKSITENQKAHSERSTVVLGIGHSGQYKGLADVELGPVKGSNFVSSLSTSERQDVVLETRPGDSTRW